jgi:hypothetical protein
MAQHHTSTITTTAVFSIILSLIIFSMILPNSFDKVTEQRVLEYKQAIDTIYSVEKENITTFQELAEGMFKNNSSILRLTYKGKDIFPFDETTFYKEIIPDDFQKFSHRDFEVYFSISDVNKGIALNHLQHFFMIIMVVFAFALLYTRHFAQNVSDILHIMNTGMRKKEYNLQIKINPHYENHEVFRLAKFYNEAYLPAKMKRLHKEQDNSLSMNDLLKFNSKE